MDEQKLLQLPMYLVTHLDSGWTFLLLLVRFSGLFLFLPGLAVGTHGLEFRIPAIMIISLAVMSSTTPVPIPNDIVLLMTGLLSELILGSAIALIPSLIVAGAQTGGQLASTSMGLGAGQLFDPTTQTQSNQVSRIMGDLIVLSFLFLDGHHIVLYAASGLGDKIIPGTFAISDGTVDLLIKKSGDIFNFAIIVSSPVVVALLLTQLILGLLSKFVQQVNVFIVSFPLTIAVGMILMVMVLPSFARIGGSHIISIEGSVLKLLESAEWRNGNSP
jgi:flagellar biosynthesis protein FliR